MTDSLEKNGHCSIDLKRRTPPNDSIESNVTNHSFMGLSAMYNASNFVMFDD